MLPRPDLGDDGCELPALLWAGERDGEQAARAEACCSMVACATRVCSWQILENRSNQPYMIDTSSCFIQYIDILYLFYVFALIHHIYSMSLSFTGVGVVQQGEAQGHKVTYFQVHTILFHMS